MKIIVLAFVLLLSACGGGDWTEEELRKDADPPNCAINPNSCG